MVLPNLSDFEGATYAPPKSRSDSSIPLPECPPTPKKDHEPQIEEETEATPQVAPALPPVDEPKGNESETNEYIQEATRSILTVCMLG